MCSSFALSLAFWLTISAAEESPLRGQIMATLDRTSYTLGALCVAGDGTVFAENERSGKFELLRLNRDGKVLWHISVFDAVRPTNSAFGRCDDTGVVYGIHGSTSNGGSRTLIARVSNSGTVEWTSELRVPTCNSTLLHEVTQDNNGSVFVGGKLEKCTDGGEEEGYVAHFGADGSQLNLSRFKGLQRVRHLTFDGNQILAVGERYGSTNIVSLAADGTRRWIRSNQDLGLDSAIEGIVAGGAGTFICSRSYLTKKLLLVRIDDQGHAMGSWSYDNRSTPLFSKCLISDPNQQNLALVTEGRDTKVEIVRIPVGADPVREIVIDNPLGFTRGYGISNDGRTFYASGPDKSKGPNRTQIVRYALPEQVIGEAR